MTKRYISELVQASYSNNELDNKRVEKIASLLSRKDLKAYIRALKLAEKSRTVSLVLPDAKVYNSSSLTGIFTGKKIVVKEDPSLLLGLKIIDNDMIYDMTLKNNLETFIKEVNA